MLKALIPLPLLLAVGCGGEPATATKTGFSGAEVAITTPTGQPYSVDGQLTQQDINTLLHLSWPQSYDAIKDRFGLPAYRDGQLDYYQLPNGHWTAIQYQDSTAIRYSFSDSQ